MSFSPELFQPELLDSIADGLVVLDHELKYLYVNSASERLLEKPREELLGRYVWDVFPQERDSAFRAPIEEALATGKTTHVVRLNPRRGIWFDVTTTPTAHGLTIIMRDVSDQKRAELAILESENRFRTLADDAPVMIWIAGLDKGCFFFNKEWLDFTGRTLEQEYGNGWAEGVHLDDVERCMEIYTTAFDRRESFKMDYRLRRHDGEYRWLVDNGRPLFNPDGEFTGFIGSCIDINERRRLEEQAYFLAEATRRYNASLQPEDTLREIAAQMVPHLADWCAIDLLSKPGQLERVAVAHKDPSRQSWATEIHQRYPPNLESDQGLGEVLRTGKPLLIPDITDEMIVAGAQDEEHLALLRGIGFTSALIVPLLIHGQPRGTITMIWSETGAHYTETDLLFAQEVAARASIAIENAQLYEKTRKAERALREANDVLEERVAERTRQLEVRNRELHDFTSVASHDLQEPLRKIRTFTGLLEADYAPQLDEDARHMIARVRLAAERMSRLIADLLVFSRLTTLSRSHAQTDLRATLDAVLADLEQRIHDTGGRVETGPLDAILIDPLQLHQTLLNLIGNGLKFHRPGVPPVVRVWTETTPKAVRLIVEDNGIGIDSKYIDRIFAPFQRLHGRDAFEGTGMGLAIVRRISERHDGKVDVQSTPEKGTRFTVTFPTLHATAHAATG